MHGRFVGADSTVLEYNLVLIIIKQLPLGAKGFSCFILGIVVHYESNKIATPKDERWIMLKIKEIIKVSICIGENSTFSNVQT